MPQALHNITTNNTKNKIRNSRRADSDAVVNSVFGKDGDGGCVNRKRFVAFFMLPSLTLTPQKH